MSRRIRSSTKTGAVAPAAPTPLPPTRVRVKPYTFKKGPTDEEAALLQFWAAHPIVQVVSAADAASAAAAAEATNRQSVANVEGSTGREAKMTSREKVLAHLERQKNAVVGGPRIIPPPVAPPSGEAAAPAAAAANATANPAAAAVAAPSAPAYAANPAGAAPGPAKRSAASAAAFTAVNTEAVPPPPSEQVASATALNAAAAPAAMAIAVNGEGVSAAGARTAAGAGAAAAAAAPPVDYSGPGPSKKARVGSKMPPRVNIVAEMTEAAPAAPVKTYDLNPVFFVPERLVLKEDWDSRSEGSEPDGLVLRLKNFGLGGENEFQTLAMRVTVPPNSDTWALNICPANSEPGEDLINVMYHFNPRRNKGRLVQNSCTRGSWDDAVQDDIKIVQPPSYTDTTYDLAIQMTEAGFYVSTNGVARCGLRDRGLLRAALQSNDRELLLHFPKRDSFTGQQVVIVHRVWWGQKNLVPGAEQVDLAGGPRHRTNELIVKNLPHDMDRNQLGPELERLFTPLNNGQTPTVRLMNQGTYAFVALVSHDVAAAALAALHGGADVGGVRVAVDWARNSTQGHQRRQGGR